MEAELSLKSQVEESALNCVAGITLEEKLRQGR